MRWSLKALHVIIIIIIIIIIISKKARQCKAGRERHPIGPKTPAPQYQPIEWKKRKG